MSSLNNETTNTFNKKNYAMEFYTPKVDKSSDYKRYSGGQQFGGIPNDSFSPVKPSLSPNIAKSKKDTSVDMLISSPKKSVSTNSQNKKQDI
jgi:hypothetical protein